MSYWITYWVKILVLRMQRQEHRFTIDFPYEGSGSAVSVAVGCVTHESSETEQAKVKNGVV